MNSQSIVIISQYFSPDSVSTAQLMTDLAVSMTNLNWSVQVVTSSAGNNNEHCSEKIKIKRIKSGFHFFDSNTILFKALNAFLFLFKALFFTIFCSPKNTCLVIASNPPFVGLIGVVFKIIKRGHFVFILQDIFPESAVLCRLVQDKGPTFNLFNCVMTLIYEFSDKTVVLSDSMKKFLIKKYSPEKLNLLNKITVIENWSVECPDNIKKNDNSFAKANGLDREFVILYSGNLGRLHDIESIAEAALLISHEQNIRFVFIGQGYKKDWLQNFVKIHSLKNVSLFPLQPRESINLTLTACDVSLVSLIPGAEEIIAPCKLYGMLASGRAILSVSSSDSYIEEMLAKNSCGLNCPPNSPHELAEKIMWLYRNPDDVSLMGSNARALYEARYTVSRAIQEYETLISAI